MAGNLVYDLIAGPLEELVWDTTQWPRDFAAGLGGNGAAGAYAAARLDCRVQLVTAAGDDDIGRTALQRLRSVGVTVTSVAAAGETASTMGIFRADGARALIHRPGVLAEAFADVPSLLPFAGPDTDWVHIANPFAVPALRRRAPAYLAEARQQGWGTSLDTGWDRQGQWIEVIGPCLPHLDWLFANEVESRKLSGAGTAAGAAYALRDRGARNVVVKMGGEGCLLLLERAAEVVSVPAVPVKVVDTTGAGDCFCGGFLAALQGGFVPMAAARVANAWGAFSASAPGGTTGLEGKGWEAVRAAWPELS